MHERRGTLLPFPAGVGVARRADAQQPVRCARRSAATPAAAVSHVHDPVVGGCTHLECSRAHANLQGSTPNCGWDVASIKCRRLAFVRRGARSQRARAGGSAAAAEQPGLFVGGAADAGGTSAATLPQHSRAGMRKVALAVLWFRTQEGGTSPQVPCMHARRRSCVRVRRTRTRERCARDAVRVTPAQLPEVKRPARQWRLRHHCSGSFCQSAARYVHGRSWCCARGTRAVARRVASYAEGRGHAEVTRPPERDTECKADIHAGAGGTQRV
jgi:hypothetical protein